MRGLPLCALGLAAQSCLLAPRLARAGIVHMKELPFTGEWLSQEAMYKSDGEKPAFIHLDATFTRKKPSQIGREVANSKAYIEVLAFHRGMRDNIGLTASGTRGASEQVVLCCSSSDHIAKKCGVSKVDEVVRTQAYEDDPNTFYAKAYFNGSYSARFNPPKWPITRSGLYTVIAAVCEYEIDGTKIDGTLYFKNSYGYIPGHMRGFMPFWAWMLGGYLLLAVIWAILAACYWRDLLHLQICITGLLFMGLVETCAWNITYTQWNDTGEQPRGLMGTSVVIGSLKRSVARMLVIVVSMGYGVVKPTLNDRKNKVILFGVAYFVFGGLLEVMTMAGHNAEYSTLFRLMFVLPVAALDSIGAIWIFMELSTTVTQLSTRRQTAKLALYRRFTNVIGVLVVFSIIWSLREMWVTSGPRALDFEKRWQQYWALEAFWPGLYMAVLTSIMWLWAPSKNARRYAYSEELAFDSDDEYLEDDDYEAQDGGDGETVPLAVLGDASKRRSGEDAGSGTRDAARHTRDASREPLAADDPNAVDEVFFAMADPDELEDAGGKMQ